MIVTEINKIANDDSILLYKTSPSGKELFWSCTLEENKLHVEYGQVQGTPIANIVSCESVERAKQEYATRVNAKIEREGYALEGMSTQRTFPMLATTYDQAVYYNLPLDGVCIQPKLDGIRCIASVNGLHTRSDKLITSAPHIRLACNLSPETYLDGELYIEGASFDEHLEIINRKTPHKRWPEIKYNVFDIVCEGSFEFRMNLLRGLYANWNPQFINLVPTHKIQKQEIELYHTQFIEQGYEGSIIRLPNSKYQCGVRSKGLIKKKDEQDCLADIIDITTGIEGKEANCALFVCRLESGQIITVRPKMTLFKRQHIYANRYKYIPKNETYSPTHFTEIRHYGVNKSGNLRQARAYGINKK